MKIILAPGTTDSVTSNVFHVVRRKGELREVTVTLYPEANLGTDIAVLKKLAPDGTYVTCSDDNGDIELGADRAVEVVVAPGSYVLTAATRTSAWGISIDGEDD